MNTKSCGVVVVLILLQLSSLWAEEPEMPVPAAISEELVRLEFREQPWPDVLLWLAEKSHLNLDWQELPEGALNLASSKEYTLAEAHDLINMQLLARGFTLLVHGEVLRVAKLDKLDPTLVARVEPEDLESLPAHQFARVSFPMNWMIADEAAEEFASLLSPYGKLHPMASTNRLEAVDAVVNLRTLQRLLMQAEQDENRRERVVEFAMKHRRAEEIAPKVRQLLGLPAAEVAEAAVPSQLDLEKTRFRSEAVKQLGAGAQPLLEDKPTIHLIVNDEENSIVVHARSDRIEIARQAIEALDKPLPIKDSPWEEASRMKTFEVIGFDVATFMRFVKALQQERKLEEETRVEHDAEYNRIIVFGSPEDQLTIAGLLESFKTDSRQAEVISLVSLDPHYAAKAVQTVLKNPERPSAAPGAASDGQFQVEPDPNNDRLLLWATPKETDEVRRFLAQLGESFVSSDSAQRLHVVSTNGVGLHAIEGQFERMWNEMSDAPLKIEKSRAPAATPKEAPAADAIPPDPSANIRPVAEPVALAAARIALVTQLTAAQPPQEETAAPPADAAAPPAETESEPSEAAVQLIEGDDGKVVITSKNPRSAAAAKALLEGLLPLTAAVRVVKLEHADASEVQEQLSAVLKQSDSTPSSALAPQQDFSIEADSRSNSLIIQNVSEEQSRLIDKMTPLLDAPTPKDREVERVQRIYQVRNADASEIAETVKEVYRDLLSKSDKAFAANNVEKPLGYSVGVVNPKEKEPQYQGLLSVSADAESNKLILSAPAYLIAEVMDLVERLDTGPADSSIGVVQLSPGMDSEAIMKALNGVLEKQKRGQ